MSIRTLENNLEKMRIGARNDLNFLYSKLKQVNRRIEALYAMRDIIMKQLEAAKERKRLASFIYHMTKDIKKKINRGKKNELQVLRETERVQE